MSTQIAATFTKTIKGFLRIKAVLLGTLAWPIILLAIVCFSMLTGIAKNTLPAAEGEVTISMIVFALMLAGTCNLAGSIARDRDIGLLTKLRTLPINPIIDFSGRILALLVLSLLAVVLTAVIGISIGARFDVTAATSLEAAGFMFLVVCAAAGIGLILGSLVRNLLGTAFIGVGITVIISYLTGIFVPYSSLSSGLQTFARIYPISSASASASYLLLGQDVTGYNPISSGQIITTAVLALVLLAAGAYLYAKLSWKRE